MPVQTEFNIRYLNKEYRIKTSEEVKINGILFRQDKRRMNEANLVAIKKKIEDNCRRWTGRRLCLLGKILILKTFGVSQAIYYMQCVTLCDSDIKQLNSILYKFLWNKHFEAAKAPDRLSREIINKPIKLGGFGMLSVEELDSGLKLRALGRLFTSRHPWLQLIKAKINLDAFFNPCISTKLDKVACHGVELLKIDRRKIWDCETVQLDAKCISLIRQTRLNLVVSDTGKNSIAYFNARRLGLNKISDLNENRLNSLSRFMPRNLVESSRSVINLRVDLNIDSTRYQSFLNNKLVDLSTCSSKAIREGRTMKDPICIFKGGLINTPIETINWSNKYKHQLLN